MAAHIAVEHGHARDVGSPTDLDEQRQVALAAAVDDRDRRTVDVVAQRTEHVRQRLLLAHALDQHRGAREEQLRTLRIEFARGAELVRRLQEYERYKTTAEELDQLPRIGRDNYVVEASSPEIEPVKIHLFGSVES